MKTGPKTPRSADQPRDLNTIIDEFLMSQSPEQRQMFMRDLMTGKSGIRTGANEFWKKIRESGAETSPHEVVSLLEERMQGFEETEQVAVLDQPILRPKGAIDEFIEGLREKPRNVLRIYASLADEAKLDEVAAIEEIPLEALEAARAAVTALMRQTGADELTVKRGIIERLQNLAPATESFEDRKTLRKVRVPDVPFVRPRDPEKITASPWGARRAAEGVPEVAKDPKLNPPNFESGAAFVRPRKRGQKPTFTPWTTEAIGITVLPEVGPFVSGLTSEARGLLAAVLNAENPDDPVEAQKNLQEYAPGSDKEHFDQMNKTVIRLAEKLKRPLDNVRQALRIKLDKGEVLPEGKPGMTREEARRAPTVLSSNKQQQGILDRLLSRKKRKP